MAPLNGKPVEEETLVFVFKPSNDPHISCVVCGDGGCDLESTAYQTVRGLGHSRVTVGKHSKCTRKDITLR
ncbi:MAG TPA: hypothetical protein VFA98_09320 [Thermoanaerobaculia bacterium]|jgi:hypothetical protein|nr:hypothetical protein [Thermoanaerobaculia bacterium]